MGIPDNSVIFETAITFFKRMVAKSQRVFGALAVLFLIIAGWQTRNVFPMLLEQVKLAVLLLTMLLWASLHLLTPVFTSVVLNGTERPINYGTALGIHVQRLPARYLPGGVWHTVTRMVDLHRLGVSRRQIVILVFLENLVPLASALVLGGSLSYLTNVADERVLVVALLGLLMLVCAPLVIRHGVLLQEGRFELITYLKIVAVTVLFWCIAATAFACYWLAFPATQGGITTLQVYGAYLLAWAAGFICIFTPQGIGVFEAIIGMLLHGALPFAGIAVLATGFRVVILAADLLAYLALESTRYFAHLRCIRH